MIASQQEEATQYLVMLGLVTKLDADNRQEVQSYAKEIKAVVAKHGSLGLIALALVSAETIAKESP